MPQPTQSTLFPEKPNVIDEVVAYSFIWEFFFQEHGLMLLNEQIDDITRAVDKFKSLYDGKKETNTTGDNTPY